MCRPHCLASRRMAPRTSRSSGRRCRPRSAIADLGLRYVVVLIAVAREDRLARILAEGGCERGNQEVGPEHPVGQAWLANVGVPTVPTDVGRERDPQCCGLATAARGKPRRNSSMSSRERTQQSRDAECSERTYRITRRYRGTAPACQSGSDKYPRGRRASAGSPR